jgi:hypothetical protein
LLAAESSTETGEVAAKKSPAVGSGKDDAVWCGGVVRARARARTGVGVSAQVTEDGVPALQGLLPHPIPQRPAQIDQSGVGPRVSAAPRRWPFSAAAGTIGVFGEIGVDGDGMDGIARAGAPAARSTAERDSHVIAGAGGQICICIRTAMLWLCTRRAAEESVPEQKSARSRKVRFRCVTRGWLSLRLPWQLRL